MCDVNKDMTNLKSSDCSSCHVSRLILRLLQTVSSILTCAAIVFNFRAVKCFEDLECPNNTYGQNCSQLCSVGCAGPFDACTDGICLFGCDDGFEGPKCEKSQNGVILGVMELTIKPVRPKRCDLGCNGVDYKTGQAKTV
ncbi:hypothetical protein RRG08_009285 [Elysia crispata]|uniref:Uncharacterized protein n=1 Tax=Elysia crispata TaxID=231223 RepID=A0AAE0YGQ1_9GAST|nr:hypothetical protein RRG08_009285 [Elysia crispata]